MTDDGPTFPPPQPPAPLATPEGPEKPWWKRWWAITIAVVLVIGVIGAIAGGGGGDDDDGDAGGSVTESSATATTTATDATEPPATTTATDVTEPPATTTATDVTEPPATSVGGDGNVVEVAELGVQFEAPEGWTVVDPEDVGDLADESVLADLAERTGVSEEALQNTITDQVEVFVFSGESDGNIAPNINVIGLAVDELPPGDRVEADFEELGAGNIAVESVDAGGNDGLAVRYQVPLDDQRVAEGYGLFVDLGDEVVNLTVTTLDRAEADEVGELVTLTVGATEAPTTTRAPTKTTTTTTTTTTLPPPEPVTLEGNGNQVIPIGQTLTEAQVVVASNDGTSNFIVQSLNEGLEEIDLIVNEIGPITSRNLMNISEGETASFFDVSAEGNWRLEITELSVAIQTGVIATWDGSTPFAGSGNDVLFYDGGPGILEYSNSGDSNFIVTAYSDSGDLLINDIGPVEGSSRITAGPLVLEVQARGDWTLTVVPV